MRPFNYILARFYQARSRRAFRTYVKLAKEAEKFFSRVGL